MVELFAAWRELPTGAETDDWLDSVKRLMTDS
jgi:hypothetical protein